MASFAKFFALIFVEIFYKMPHQNGAFMRIEQTRCENKILPSQPVHSKIRFELNGSSLKSEDPQQVSCFQSVIQSIKNFFTSIYNFFCGSKNPVETEEESEVEDVKEEPEIEDLEKWPEVTTQLTYDPALFVILEDKIHAGSARVDNRTKELVDQKYWVPFLKSHMEDADKKFTILKDRVAGEIAEFPPAEQVEIHMKLRGIFVLLETIKESYSEVADKEKKVIDEAAFAERLGSDYFKAVQGNRQFEEDRLKGMTLREQMDDAQGERLFGMSAARRRPGDLPSTDQWDDARRRVRELEAAHADVQTRQTKMVFEIQKLGKEFASYYEGLVNEHNAQMAAVQTG